VNEEEMESIGKPDSRTMEEIEEESRVNEARSREGVLVMLGDIPDVDAKPPDNVIFVCKLNPVTSEEDLELIFSRFGEVVSCEVIRDWKTKESLCYAFIEYANHDDCEQAFFKMDNVLIDDRRIHVDFSQSVSKQCITKDVMVLRNFGRMNRFYNRTRQDTGGSSGRELAFNNPPKQIGAKQKYDFVFDEKSDHDSKKRKKDNKDLHSRDREELHSNGDHRKETDSHRDRDHRKESDSHRDRDGDHRKERGSYRDRNRDDRKERGQEKRHH